MMPLHDITKNNRHIVLVAGEESGDKHAAVLVGELKAKHPHMQFSGIGGQHMKDAGVSLISDLAKHGVTGLTEVLKHFKTIKKAFRDIQQHLLQQKPDLLILIDYPGFNLRLAKYAKEVLGIKILYYISPQIWAWKAGRINNIKKHVDMMAVILPFEKKIYEHAGVPVRFVGNPLSKRIPASQNQANARLALNLSDDKTIIALLPGSRKHEIERHMPVLFEFISKILQHDSRIEFVIPVARTLNRDLFIPYSHPSLKLIEQQALTAIEASDLVLCASGTASLECALMLKPMAIFYKASPLTYLAATKLIKVRYLGLSNLLANKQVIPEFLQYDFNAQALTEWVLNMLHSDHKRKHMINSLTCIRDELSYERSDCCLTELVEQQIL